MKKLLLIVPFFLLASCSHDTCDYMFALNDGVYVCDRWNFYRKYIDCEHVLTGRHVPQIDVGENITIFKVSEKVK